MRVERGLLIALATDPISAVRAQAAAALAALVVAGRADTLARITVATCLGDSGRVVPLGIATAVASSQTAEAVAIRESLRTHSSARVRAMARKTD